MEPQYPRPHPMPESSSPEPEAVPTGVSYLDIPEDPLSVLPP